MPVASSCEKYSGVTTTSDATSTSVDAAIRGNWSSVLWLRAASVRAATEGVLERRIRRL
jgi:hypothetical protein